MKFYDLIVFVHVLSAIALVGAGILATPTISDVIRRARTIDELRRWLAVGKRLGRINPLSSVALLASGAYLSSVSGWWGTAWIQVAVVLWIANAVMANAVINSAMTRLDRVAFTGDGDLIGPNLERLLRSPRTAFTHDVMIANDLGVLFLMVIKPTEYLVAVMAVAGAQLILVGVGALRRRGGLGAVEPVVPLSG